MANIARPTGIEPEIGPCRREIEPFIFKKMFHEQKASEIVVGVAAKPTPPLRAEQRLPFPNAQRLWVQTK